MTDERERIQVWMNTRRVDRRRGILSPWKIKRLERIPGWEWNPNEHIRTPEEWVPVAEQLAKANGGVLQKYHWLKNNQYAALTNAMRRRPELFKHIVQDKREGRSPEEWVPVAEKLAADMGGRLPTHTWLVNNGYLALDSSMRKNPKPFDHIKQDTDKGNSPEEWAPIAEGLAKANNGLLQSVSWLQKNGFAGLYKVMINVPSLFSHIKQERPEANYRSPEEWVPVAEQLAKDNFELLQSPSWLKKNGYSCLADAIKKRRELFAHIKQSKECRCPEEWVPVAESLAEQNGGILPGPGWLCKNGYSGLNLVIKQNCYLFAHMKQERSRVSSLKDWVLVAERLAQENKGALPSCMWLLKNGYRGLSKALAKRPDLFHHIEMEHKNKTIKEWASIAARLAEKNEGALQNSNWLQNNGYASLVHAIRVQPSLFAHIPQETRNNAGTLTGFRNGTEAQRRALEIKHGLRPGSKKRAA